MSDLKPIKLYSHPGGPNPWKVAIILTELGVPFHSEVMDFADLKKEPFESVNPNGRVPAIEDPNTGLNLWESGAIIEYLLETYDKENKLRYTSGAARWEQECWLHFQTSGQGPYFGQRAWFTFYHEEKNLKSCLDRYGNEIKRVLSVIDRHLKKTGQPYLAGEKCTYADLAFMPWHWLLPRIMDEGFAQEWEKEYPLSYQWNERVQARDAVKKCRAERDEAIKKHH